MVGKPTEIPPEDTGVIPIIEDLDRAASEVRAIHDANDQIARSRYDPQEFAVAFRSALRHPQDVKPRERKIQERFLADADRWLLAIGATANTTPGLFSSYPIAIASRAGVLLLHNYGDWVAGRFVDVPLAVETFPGMAVPFGGINRFTGKYNLHFGEATTAADRLHLLQQHVNRVLPQRSAEGSP